MAEPYVEEIETYCSAADCQVRLLLRASKEPKTALISGKPEKCSAEDGCKGSKLALCLLRVEQLTTRRRGL